MDDTEHSELRELIFEKGQQHKKSGLSDGVTCTQTSEKSPPLKAPLIYFELIHQLG